MIIKFNNARLVYSKCEKNATVQNATSGFRKAGFFPYNTYWFTGLDSAPATVYEKAPLVGHESAVVSGQRDKILLKT